MANESKRGLVDNDELAAFATSTLKAISAAISQAPGKLTGSAEDGHHTYGMPQKVSFDIAVTAKQSDQISGGLKVQVFSAGAKSDSEDQAVSRIRFEVPVTFVSTSSPPSVGTRYPGMMS